MPRGEKRKLLLGPYRVLDLTDEKGFLCGRVLADLGADVIKIESPGGDLSRNIAPFYHDIPHPEKSLFWFAYNANKRGITLNLETRQGQDIFRRLVRSADFVLESFPPGYMDSLSLGYSSLQEINPRIIFASITPFGQDGPYKDYKATDIVSMAMGGLMFLSGDPDRPPLRPSFPQAYLNAAAEAAVGALIAHYHRELTGEGQQVDISIQESIIPTLMNARPFWDLNQVLLKRAGTSRTGLSAEGKQRLIWACKDGYVTFALLGGKFGAPTNRALVNWMAEEGIAEESLLHTDWDAFDMATATQEQFDRFARPLEDFLLKHTKRELYDEALRRGIMLYPLYTIKEIQEDPQLDIRGFWEQVDHPELSTSIIYPGSFIQLSGATCRIRRRAPLIGEHNEEIYERELGFSREELVVLKQGGII